jgi:hypothetical protein
LIISELLMDLSLGLMLLLFAGIGTFIVMSIVVGFVRERRRNEQWQQVAKQLGLPFLGNDNDLLGRFGEMKLFQKGRDRQFRNAIAGDLGPVRVVLSDFRYTTGSGKNQTTRHFTVCIVQNEALDVTACYLRPERRWLDAIGSLFGGQDIDFPEDDQFSRKFVLQGESEAEVRQLFNADVRAWFCDNPLPHMQFEARGNTLALHTGKRSPPDQSTKILQMALEITKVLGRQPR